MIHELKIYSPYFEKVISGEKTFEVRQNDRDFHVGDMLALNEIDCCGVYSGKSCIVDVTYILDNQDFVKEGYVVMAIKPCVIKKQTINSLMTSIPDKKPIK